MLKMRNKFLPRLSFWNVIAGFILVAGVIVIYQRFSQGLGSVTNLSDDFPWGLWIGFDILCGVGLAAGGFTLCAIVYIFNIKRFKPIIRPTVLTAFLGYLLVIFALLIDLGRPWAIWHAIIMWNPRSVMFEVAWCVMLYTTVLFLEFSPVFLKKFKMNRLLKIIKAITIPLIIAGVLLSTLHQSSLGSLYLIIPGKMHPLWYSSYIPVYFFISAIAVGCAMIILESYLSSKAFNRQLEFSLIKDIGKWIVVALGVYGTLKFMDLLQNNKLGLLLSFTTEVYLFWLEILIGIIIPLVLLFSKKIRESRIGLFISVCFVIGGFLLNRMNISITSIEGFASTSYFPSIFEIVVTLFVVTIGVIVFNFIVRTFNVFSEEIVSKPTKVEYAVIDDAEFVKMK